MVRFTSNFLTMHKIQVMTHTPYSPDLAPSDFRLFPILKEYLQLHLYRNEYSGHHCLREIFPSDTKSGICKLSGNFVQLFPFVIIFVAVSLSFVHLLYLHGTITKFLLTPGKLPVVNQVARTATIKQKKFFAIFT